MGFTIISFKFSNVSKSGRFFNNMNVFGSLTLMFIIQKKQHSSWDQNSDDQDKNNSNNNNRNDAPLIIRYCRDAALRPAITANIIIPSKNKYK